MGQSPSHTPTSPDPMDTLEDTVDTIQYEIKRHANSLLQISSLTYEEFKACLSELNELSQKCLDSNGKTTVFAVKKGTDSSFLWKATVRIACVKCDASTKCVESYNLLNLTQFLKVFNNFHSHLEVMMSCEEQHEKRKQLTQILDNVTGLDSTTTTGPSVQLTRVQSDTECCICLDRKPNLILPCTHAYCSTCIEQWNATNKKCPVCQASLDSTSDTWVLSELPDAVEVNEKILNELNALTKQTSVHSNNDDDSDD